MHGAAAAGDEALLAVDRHHAGAVAARRLVAREPRLVKLGDERAQLEVELDGHRRRAERRLALDVGAEEAMRRDEAGLRDRKGASQACSTKLAWRDGTGRTLLSAMPSNADSVLQDRQRMRNGSQSAKR